MVDQLSDYKVIKTKYAGVLFRSRLEARWAVFFNNMKAAWEYEKEGYILDSTFYLPDFWLRRHRIWIEIKPPRDDFQYNKKCDLLAVKSKAPVLCMYGEPKLDGYFVNFYGNKTIYPEEPLIFAECRRCDTGLCIIGEGMWHSFGCQRNCTALDAMRWPVDDGERIMTAYRKAMSYSFKGW